MIKKADKKAKMQVRLYYAKQIDGNLSSNGPVKCFIYVINVDANETSNGQVKCFFHSCKQYIVQLQKIERFLYVCNLALCQQ